MKFLPLIWKNVWRRKFRTTFTLLSIFIAFLLFGILMTIRTAFSLGVDIAGLDRLVLINKVSLIMPLPVSYQRAPAAGAWRRAGHAPNLVRRRLSGSGELLRQHRGRAGAVPEDLSGVQAAAGSGARPGWPIGRAPSSARISPTRFGWKVGDRIPLTGTIWQPKQGRAVGVQHRRASTTASDGIDKTQFFFRYDYLDENRARGQGQVGWYVVKIADPSRAVELSRTFDEMFANSSAETKTTTEKGFVESFAKQIGDIGAIMIAISSTVLFMFGLVAASTMAQSVRERTSELAVLKTLGFSGTADSDARPRRVAVHRASSAADSGLRSPG